MNQSGYWFWGQMLEADKRRTVGKQQTAALCSLLLPLMDGSQGHRAHDELLGLVTHQVCAGVRKRENLC
jgi:hypothetical protein